MIGITKGGKKCFGLNYPAFFTRISSYADFLSDLPLSRTSEVPQVNSNYTVPPQWTPESLNGAILPDISDSPEYPQVDSCSNSGLSGAVIGGIVGGVIGAFLLITGVALLCRILYPTIYATDVREN